MCRDHQSRPQQYPWRARSIAFELRRWERHVGPTQGWRQGQQASCGCAAQEEFQGQPQGFAGPRFWLSSMLPIVTGRCSTGSESFFCPLRRAHSAAGRVEQNSGQQAWLFAGITVGSVNSVSGENGLNIIPKRLIDDGLMLAWIALDPMDDFPTVDPILQHQVKRTAGQRLTAIRTAVGGRPDLAGYAGTIEILFQFAD